jgi:hypothetical protein
MEHGMKNPIKLPTNLPIVANVWRVYAGPFAAMIDQFPLRQMRWSELNNISLNNVSMVNTPVSRSADTYRACY